MEDVVLETLMFSKPPEWGRRVVQRGNEILLQSTEDSGQTWKDQPIPEFKLIVPESKTRTLSSNTYSGLIFQQRGVRVRSLDSVDLKPDESLQSILDSGQLLVTTEVKIEHVTIEEMRFLGTYAQKGLPSGSLWRDNENYIRVVP